MTELVIPDPSCVLLIGAAGAGKTTFAARHFPAEAVLSSDALRATIGRGEDDQAVSRTAFAVLHRTLDRRLAAGRLTVIDATNVSPAARHAVRRIAARHDVPVVAIVLDLPEAVVHARNRARPGRQVPDAIVARQLERVRATVDAGTLATEGYRRVVRLTSPAEVDALVIRPTVGGAA